MLLLNFILFYGLYHYILCMYVCKVVCLANNNSVLIVPSIIIISPWTVMEYYHLHFNARKIV